MFRSRTQPATSLGGVESLIEHRLGTDPDSDPRLVRLSVGVEELEVCVAAAIYVRVSLLIYMAEITGFERRPQGWLTVSRRQVRETGFPVPV